MSIASAILGGSHTHRAMRGHPWVFRNEITALDGQPGDGDEVQVRDGQGRVLGHGWYSSRSLIAIRLVARGEAPLTDDLLRARLGSAIALRREILPDLPCRRLVASEGDRLPGLIVDQYHRRLVIQATTAGADRRMDFWRQALVEMLEPEQIVERNDVAVREREGLPQRAGVLVGQPSTGLRARLGSCEFPVDLLDPHKTGSYLDQQGSHLLARGWCRTGGRVLDCFSHLGGFALHALAGGAAQAVAIDQSERALAGAREAAAWAGCADRLRTEAADAFDWLKRAESAGERFDLVVLDPPAFARGKDAVAAALRGYQELHRRGLRLTAPGGRIATFSCSQRISEEDFLATLVAAASQAGLTLRLEARLGQHADHPVLPAVPETRYLKGFLVRVLGA